MEISNLKEAEKFMKTAEVGSSWVFSGWPDPITEESLEEYDKLEEAARKLESEIFDYISGYVADDKDKEDKGNSSDKRTIKVKE